jgi:predicted O-methyltransferase YrrM
MIPTLTGQLDFAFIDAEKSEYLQYLKLIEDKLCKAAVISQTMLEFLPTKWATI